MDKPIKMFRFLVISCLLFLISIPIVAWEYPPANNPGALTVILVIDNSGSMKTNDPNGLRFTGARMFLSLLDDQDFVGVVRFSTASRLLTNGLVSLSTHRMDLLDQVQPVPANGYTDLKAALEDVRQMMTSSAQAKAGRVGVIVLTDGKPEIEHPYPAYDQQILDLARSLDVPIYAIALTPNADLSFLNRLVAGTGGAVIPARSASDLLDAYLQAFSAIEDRTVIGSGLSVSPGQAVLTIDPALAPYIEKVSFVLSKPENITAQLMSPDGHLIAPGNPDLVFSSRDDPRFMVMTISHPAGGEWAFELNGSGQVQARAILYSRLRAEIVSPGRFHKAGEPMPVVVRLLEEKNNGQSIKIIGQAAFSALITRPDGTQESLDRFYDDGIHGDVAAGDGDYTRLYVETSQIGQYHIIVAGRKGAVVVGQETNVEGIEFPALVVDAPRGAYDIRGQPVTLKAHLTGGNTVVLNRGEIVARITAPSGKTQEITLRGSGSAYTGELFPLESGKYLIQIETRGAAYLDIDFRGAAQTEFEAHVVHTITVQPPTIEVLAGCFGDSARALINLPLASIQSEPVSLALEGLPDFVLQPRAMNVQSGQQKVVLTIRPSEREPQAGEYHANLILTGQTGLMIQPGGAIPINFVIPSLWGRCQESISWGVGLLFFVVIVGIVAARRVQASTSPPIVTGTLRWWPEGATPAGAQEFDLTALQKTAITIGGKEGCDLLVRGSRLADCHAVFTAEKALDNVFIYLQPVDVVKKGYGTIGTRIRLEHAGKFSMADLNFQYLSDSGE